MRRHFASAHVIGAPAESWLGATHALIIARSQRSSRRSAAGLSASLRAYRLITV
jgi:hypothetical protein